MKISIFGAGYVGLSLAALFATKHQVVLCDISKEKVNMLQHRISPIHDQDIQMILSNPEIHIEVTLDLDYGYRHGDVIFIATPTNYNPEKNYFDTESVDETLKNGMRYNKNAIYVIKSTIPVGYTSHMNALYPEGHILFSPEFLREDRALYDNLYPSRIVVGHTGNEGKMIASLLKNSALKHDIPILLTSSMNAEAIKLFANTYLAMRISFFNELDTFSELKKLNTLDLITGIGLDPRIGLDYNNPSFGYGGYCLPKDTKQLLANYEWIPQNLMRAIVESNETRKEHIVEMVVSKKPELIGIYRLTMKKNSDNIRESSIQGVITGLIHRNQTVLIYEPLLTEKQYLGCSVTHDLVEFKRIADLIVCNRYEQELEDVIDKVYTRDIFSKDS
jgi:UDPglucose 6-dehydrogenase